MKKWPLSLFVLFCLAPNSLGLEVGERLTVRILKTSQSKKTVLLNRGTEDALVEGDHGKIFLTSGVIARGVAVKVSPTRSIWSLYRIVDREKLFPDKVANLQVTPPAKLTQDPTRSLQKESESTSTGASGLTQEEEDELATLENP